jgi:hypothetical protein
MLIMVHKSLPLNYLRKGEIFTYFHAQTMNSTGNRPEKQRVQLIVTLPLQTRPPPTLTFFFYIPYYYIIYLRIRI